MSVLRPRKGERVLPVVTALLLVISFPPLHLLLPPFIALVPLALFIHDLPVGREGGYAAFRGGFLLGLVYFGLLLYWILVALVWFSKLAILAYLGTILVLAFIVALSTRALHSMHHGAGVPVWLALPVAWTACEWLRAHLPDNLAFPWLGLGTSLTGYPKLVGIAEVVGARGITLWLAAVNGLLAHLLLQSRSGRPWRRAAAASAALVLLPMMWGIWRAGSLEMRPVGKVAVVQPNIPEHVKLDRRSALDSTKKALDFLMPRVPPGSVDLVVWPEAALTTWFLHPGALPVRRWVQDKARLVDAPVLVGSFGYEEEGDVQARFNSAFLMTPDGVSDFTYHKRYLVPIIERVPILPPEWFGALEYFGGLGKGREASLGRDRDGDRFGVLICYESTYAEGARSLRLAGADFLLNITNDAWYGREPWYAQTTALWQHPAHTVMRAIENRVGVARSANTGISLFVDPVGEVHNTTALFEADLRIMPVYTTDVVTFYTRFGDLAGRGAIFAFVILVGTAWWRNRRRAW